MYIYTYTYVSVSVYVFLYVYEDTAAFQQTTYGAWAWYVLRSTRMVVYVGGWVSVCARASQTIWYTPDQPWACLIINIFADTYTHLCMYIHTSASQEMIYLSHKLWGPLMCVRVCVWVWVWMCVCVWVVWVYVFVYFWVYLCECAPVVPGAPFVAHPVCVLCVYVTLHPVCVVCVYVCIPCVCVVCVCMCLCIFVHIFACDHQLPNRFCMSLISLESLLIFMMVCLHMCVCVSVCTCFPTDFEYAW